MSSAVVSGALWHGGRDDPGNVGSKTCSRFPIEALPGWNGSLPSAWATGWGHAGTAPNNKGAQYIHYLFIAAEDKPESAPVVVWYNGGPGASSLFGLFVELGPLLLNAQSLEGDSFAREGLPRLMYNRFGWTRAANLLIIDNPPPIGFSYCEPAGTAAGGYSCGDWDDGLVAVANAAFLENWVTAFPELEHNPLYITGESYAGVYVPIIVKALQDTPHSRVNLRGFAVGDGCMGKDVLCGEKAGPFYSIEFLHGHGQMSNKLYRDINQACTPEELHHGQLSPKCTAQTNLVSKQVGGYYGEPAGLPHPLSPPANPCRRQATTCEPPAPSRHRTAGAEASHGTAGTTNAPTLALSGHLRRRSGGASVRPKWAARSTTIPAPRTPWSCG